jgi:preprotein translocase subunit SecF
MQFIKKTNIDFMKYKFAALALSGVLITIGIINMTVGKGINYGIDFAGGTMVRLIFANEVPISDVRGALRDAGIENNKIQKLGDTGREFIIRTMQDMELSEQGMESHEVIGRMVVDSLRGEDEKRALEEGTPDLNSIAQTNLAVLLETPFPEKGADIAEKIINFRNHPDQMGIILDYSQLETIEGINIEVINYLKKNTFLSRLSVLSKESVGPQVGEDLRRKATQATIWALIGMLIYIGIRFKYAYGVAAILTLAHDVLVTLGIFSLTNREINLPVIAAIMTLVGYSLNDTIVIFDRVRDNLKLLRKRKFGDLLNISINQTLSRTIITSGTTFLTVFTLFLLGGEVISDFAFTMMIGVVIGTYSSIYQSCSILFFWKNIFKPKKGMGKL